MSKHEKPRRLQFGLSWLFWASSMVAVCKYLARYVGFVESAGIGIALLLATAAIQWRGDWYRWAWRSFFGLTAAGVVWMVAVDYCIWQEYCPICLSNEARVQYRVLSHPVWEWRSTGSSHLAEIAEDLGCPCQHDLQVFLKHRWWGLIYPNPCINGIWGFSAPDWYDERMRQRARQIGRENPELGKEFRAALDSKNYPAAHKIADRIRGN